MADLLRSALPEVLAALTGTDVRCWQLRLETGVGLGAGHAVSLDATWPWLHAGPAEAQELLSERGLLPEGWCGDPRRGWYCETCNGTGWRLGLGYHRECYDCRQRDDRPSTISDLVAVASLGWPAIQRAEELAREACRALRAYGCPQPERVVWRVGYRMLPGDFAWRLRGPYGVQRDGAASFPGGVVGPVRSVAALWKMGLALDAITPDAVQIAVPPVAGAA